MLCLQRQELDLEIDNRDFSLTVGLSLGLEILVSVLEVCLSAADLGMLCIPF